MLQISLLSVTLLFNCTYFILESTLVMAKDISKLILKLEDEASWLNLVELSEQRVVGKDK